MHIFVAYKTENIDCLLVTIMPDDMVKLNKQIWITNLLNYRNAEYLEYSVLSFICSFVLDKY